MTGSASPPSRPPGRPPVLSSDERRRAILAAAEQAFSVHGYANASMTEIARQAGMSKKTLYAVFLNKRSLFEALAYDVDALSAAIELPDGEPSLATLRQSLRNTALFALSPRQVLVTRMLIAAPNTDLDLAPGFRDNVINAAQSHHARLLAALVDDKSLPPQHWEQLARQVFGFVIGDLHVLSLVGIQLPHVEEQLDRQLDSAMTMVQTCLTADNKNA